MKQEPTEFNLEIGEVMTEQEAIELADEWEGF